jgi:hypothetical protein
VPFERFELSWLILKIWSGFNRFEEIWMEFERFEWVVVYSQTWIYFIELIL